MRALSLLIFTGLLFALSQCVQNGGTESNNSATAALDGENPTQERVNGITSRSGKAINFFPDESASSGHVDAASQSVRHEAAAARRVRFGDDEDTNYVNDIGGGPAAVVVPAVEIGERRPVYAYKRPDDGAVYQSSNPSSNNYYSRPYEYSYNEQGQYYNPQPSPNYYSQAPQRQQQQQPGNYYRPRPQNSPRPPPTSSAPAQQYSPAVSQTYQHIPYPQSQGYLQQQQQQPQYPSQYSQQSQYPQQQPHPYSGASQGPYYSQQQQQQQRPPYQFDNYSPNYPYQGNAGGGGGGGGGESGVGGLLGGLGSLFSGNGLGGGGGGSGAQNGLGAVGGQFGYAIENIVRFDDYQCVPKIVCQMVGNPQRAATLPGWLNAPSLTALISAVPSTSPMLVFGRAALLGLSGGENHCDSSYPRCPRNEDDVLNYLNNHRGGFFRFFNGGASYGDESDYGYDTQQQPQYQQQQYDQQYQQQQQYQPQQQQQQQSPIQGLDLGTIQSIAEAINGGGGINLSNLGSNLGLLGNLASLGSALGAVTGGGGGGAAAAATKPAPVKQTPASSLASNLGLLSSLGSQLGLGNTVSNLLTGIVGARFNGGRKARKLKKRNAVFSDESLDELLLSLGEEQQTTAEDSNDPPSKKRNLNKEIGDDATKVDNMEKVSQQKRKKYHQESEKKEKIRTVEKLLGVQARIINKEEIQAEAEQRIVHGNLALNSESLLLNPIVFPDNYEQVVHIRPPQATRAAAPALAFPGQDLRSEKSIHQSFVFPAGFQSIVDSNRGGGKAFQFAHSSVIQPSAQQIPFNHLQFPENYQNSDGIILDIPQPLPLEYYDRTKMIFPDRTGTGNLRFDSEAFDQSPFGVGQNRIRIGRILTGGAGGNQNRPVSYQGSYNEHQDGSSAAFNRGDVLIFHSNNYSNGNDRQRPQYDFGNRYPIGSNNQVNSNRYQQPTNNYNAYNTNRYQSGLSSSSGNSHRDNGQKIYVTNGQGVTTHYINERGEKIAV